MTCPACGEAITPADRFCASCGRALRPTDDERRIVTVLFADIVGFTSVSERLDPEQVKNLVDRCFDLLGAEVEAFGGRVDKVMGDAVIALFGAPVAHEDDAERAVRAGLRLHEVLQAEADTLDLDLTLRVGINTGEVLIGAIRAAGSVTAMGDVVNTAARLQTFARPGEVVVGDATREATVASIAYESLGRRELRGRADAVAVWRAVGPITAPGHRRHRRDLPLIGRDNELMLLDRAVEQSLHKSRALIVLLVADVGLGKSRLAAEVARRIDHEPGVVIREGRCLPYGEANVWWPIAEVLRAGVGLDADTDSEEVEALLAEHVRRVLPTASVERELERVTNGLLTVLGVDRRGDVDAGQASAEAGRSLVSYARALTDRVPLVLQVSDLHFADSALLGLIDEVMAELHNRPIVVLATARPTLLEHWQPSTGRHNTIVLHLDPLDRTASAALLHELTGRPLPDDFATDLLDRSGGNPFFIEELVSLIDVSTTDSGTVSVVASDGEASTLADVRGHAGDHAFSDLGRGRALPVTLHGLVAARLDDLDPQARLVLQDASVIGRRGPVDGLLHLVRYAQPSDEIDTLAALERLVDGGILELDDGSWTFRSDLVRDVAYQTLTKFDRARFHHAIAAYLEADTARQRPRPVWLVDQLASHWGAAAALTHELGSIAPVAEVPDDVTSRAAHWVVQAAQRAHREGSLPTAIRRFRQAIELTEQHGSDAAVIADLHLQLADVALESWDVETAGHAVEQAQARIPDPDSALAARAATVSGRIGQRIGATDTAVAHLVDAVRIFDRLGDVPGSARALRARALSELLDGRERDARRSAEAALHAYERIDEPLGRGWALQHLGWVTMLEGDLVEAEALLESAIADFRQALDTRGLVWARGLLGWVHHARREFDEALHIGRENLEEARTRRDPWAKAMMTMLIGAVHVDRGEIASAIEPLTESRHDFLGLGGRYGRDRSGALLGRALIASGRGDAGWDLLDSLDSHGMHTDSTAAAVETIRFRAAARTGEPDRVGGSAAIERAARGSGDRPDPEIALLLLQTGDLDTARRLLGDTASEDPAVLTVRALLAAVTGTGGLDELVRAVGSAADAVPFERVAVQIARAVAAASDDPDEAGAALAAAREVADSTDDRTIDEFVDLAAMAISAGAEAIPETAAPGWHRWFGLTRS